MVATSIATIISLICFFAGWVMGKQNERTKRLNLVGKLLKEAETDEEMKIILKFNYL
jgi:hypothetical protein